jgi:hypothetical protein
MRKLCIVIIAFCLCSFAQQKQPPSVEGKSSGDCSPNILANSGGVQFVCKTTVDEATAKKIVSLLNQILKKEDKNTSGSNDLVNHKLDEILDFLKNQSRRLSDSQKDKLIGCLRKKPGRFSIAALSGNSEAYRYAEDWRAVFIAAGWEIEHKDIPIQIVMIAGGMWSGLRFSVHDASTTPSQIALAVGSPEENLHQCLVDMKDNVPGGGSIIPYKDTPTGVISLIVSDRPQQ